MEGEVNIMRMYDSLTPSVRSELTKLSDGINHHPKIESSHKQFKERLTRREVEELMGTNRDRYKRVNGKVKRK